MLRSFEMVYREKVPSAAGQVSGAPDASHLMPRTELGPHTFTMVAEDEEAARRLLEGQGYAVVQVTDLGPVVQFDRPVYNRDEAAALLGIAPGTLSHKLEAGEIPWNKKIGGVERAVLLQYIRNHYNAAGKNIVKELANAA